MSQVPPPPQPPYGQAPGFPPAGQGYPPAGQGFPPPGGAPVQRKTSGAAIASLILGILGCVPFITGLLAIVFGIVGIGKTKDPRYSGRGLAIAGLLLGLLSVTLWGLFGGGLYGMYVYGKPAREAANAFARDLSAGDVPAAQARCTGNLSREELVAAAEKVKPWGALRDTTMPVASLNKSGGVETFDVVGVAVFANAPNVPYAVHLVKQGGEFKVDGFLLQHQNATVTAGTAPKTTTTGTSASRLDD